jgi:8-oxo-dGTP diphosphatase
MTSAYAWAKIIWSVPNVRWWLHIAHVPAAVVVDVANVMGARADGWWRDRAGAAARLGREVVALAGRGLSADPDPDPDPDPDAASDRDQAGRFFPSYVLVLEGQSRAAAAPIEAALLESEMIDYVPPRVRVVSAAGSGDDTIVDVVAEIVENFDAAAEDVSCLVVTADRELRRRCAALGAATTGPGWLLGLL